MKPQLFLKIFVVFALSGLFSQAIPANNYYVKQGGSDQQNGRSDSGAYATIAKAVSSTRSGDVICLHRGDVFRENAFLPDGVSLKDYGTDARLPVVSGAIQISGWTPWTSSGLIFSATVSQKVVNLFVNGKLMRIARYPNSGWLWTKTNNANSTVVTSDGLVANPRNADGYWNNCTMRWRHWSWYYDTRTITAYSAAGGTMTLAGTPSNGSGNGEKGWGFYCDGKLSELDTTGEWFFDASANMVYLYPPAGVNVQNALIEGMWNNSGISVSNGTVEHINFRHFSASGLELTRASVVDGCLFEGIGSDSGGAALSITWDSKGIAVRNSRFENCLNLAISWIQNPSSSSPSFIEKDTFVNIGSIPGYGGSGPWHAAGIIINAGKNIHVRQNVFDTIGYAAILFGDPGNFAEYNIINAAMATMNDGAGIYTNCDSSTIRHNIITNSEGDWESSGWHIRLGHGIWPEFLEHFKYNVIDSNTCAYNNGNGIFLPNNFHSSIKHNVCYGNLGEGQIHIEGGFYTDDKLPLYDTIAGNVFYALDSACFAITYRPEYDYGVIGGNYYCNPKSENVIGQYNEAGWDVMGHSLSWWKTNWSQADMQAKTDIIKRPNSAAAGDLTGASKLIVNTTDSRQAISIGDNGIYKDLDSNEAHGTVTLGSFSSTVLVHTGRTAPVLAPRFDQRKSSFLVNADSRQPVLHFFLERPSIVRCDIFNPSGRKVVGLADRTYNSGSHSIQWSGKANNHGLFLYRLQVNDGTRKEVETGRLLRTK
jgi:hypothetical protein